MTLIRCSCPAYLGIIGIAIIIVAILAVLGWYSRR